jgi:hypothetical protein
MEVGSRDSKKGRLRAALMELWTQHKGAGTLPTSGRFLYYELVTREVISKARTGARRSDQDMTDALTSLREDGLVPWEDIVDETRSLEDYTGAGDVKQWVLLVLNSARIDPWAGKLAKGTMNVTASPNVPTIITESRSLAGVLRPVAARYAARIASTNGQARGFLRTKIAPILNQGQRVLYFGDLDFSGGHIEANTRRVLEQEVGVLAWERLALTQEQAPKYKLTPISKFDKRDRKFHDAIETEALSQEIIVETLRDHLDALLPEPLKAVLEREERQRKEVFRILTSRKR